MVELKSETKEGWIWEKKKKKEAQQQAEMLLYLWLFFKEIL